MVQQKLAVAAQAQRHFRSGGGRRAREGPRKARGRERARDCRLDWEKLGRSLEAHVYRRTNRETDGRTTLHTRKVTACCRGSFFGAGALQICGYCLSALPSAAPRSAEVHVCQDCSMATCGCLRSPALVFEALACLQPLQRRTAGAPQSCICSLLDPTAAFAQRHAAS